MTPAAYRGWGMLFALAGTIAFAFRPVLIKLGYEAAPVSATTLLFLRMTLSLPFFAAVAWWLRREPPLARHDWAGIVALGLLGYYLASLLDFLGLQYVSAGLGRLIMFLYPTLVVILSALFLARRPTRRELAALALTYAGIALVLAHSLGVSPEHRQFLLGAALVFGSAMSYAVYLVTGSQLVKRVGSMRFTAYTMMVSTVPAVVQFALLETPAALELPGEFWAYAILLATACTVLPVFLVAEALKRIGANHFALIGALGPVTTVLADFGLLDGTLTPLQLMGGALVISGVLLVTLKKG
ncbi:MAG: DMT family transporter [Betaproteobacteria bacterium]|nr:DMT family transporter [Betaproteobacteria bacterium]MDH5349239.1 DMT family transporter [Betaproteobacteria bacterium]